MAVYLNLAAVHMALQARGLVLGAAAVAVPWRRMRYCAAIGLHCALPRPQEFGTAVQYCSRALELEPANAKALLRRSKAHTGRHDYAAAAADLEALRQLDPLSIEAAEQAAALEQARQADRRQEQRVFAGMFERGRLAPEAAVAREQHCQAASA